MYKLVKSGIAKSVGLLLLGLAVCAGIGIAVYYGVAAILKNVQGIIKTLSKMGLLCCEITDWKIVIYFLKTKK